MLDRSTGNSLAVETECGKQAVDTKDTAKMSRGEEKVLLETGLENKTKFSAFRQSIW